MRLQTPPSGLKELPRGALTPSFSHRSPSTSDGLLWGREPPPNALIWVEHVRETAAPTLLTRDVGSLIRRHTTSQRAQTGSGFGEWFRFRHVDRGPLPGRPHRRCPRAPPASRTPPALLVLRTVRPRAASALVFLRRSHAVGWRSDQQTPGAKPNDFRWSPKSELLPAYARHVHPLGRCPFPPSPRTTRSPRADVQIPNALPVKSGNDLPVRCDRLRRCRAVLAMRAADSPPGPDAPPVNDCHLSAFGILRASAQPH